jgi:hypothetical protein
MSNYNFHALNEFKAAGWLKEDGTYVDEMQEAICKHVLALLDVFADEGHSGSSAPYTINLFSKLAKFEPVAPLTGEDWEWNEISDDRTNGITVYQNKRMSSVFKQSDRFDGKAYWIDGKVFWEWVSHPDIDEGRPYKSYYTGKDSFVTIDFPWVKPDKSEYVFVPTKEFPNESLIPMESYREST